MPELPEVESLRRILAREVVGRRVVSAVVKEARLRRAIAPDLAARITGCAIARVARRAKYLLIEFDGDSVLMVHLGMSGSLTYRPRRRCAQRLRPAPRSCELHARRRQHAGLQRSAPLRPDEAAAARGARLDRGIGGDRPRALREGVQRGVPLAGHARACWSDQKPADGPEDRRWCRQYLCVRNPLPRGRAADPPGRPGHAGGGRADRERSRRRCCARRSAAAARPFAAIATRADSPAASSSGCGFTIARESPAWFAPRRSALSWSASVRVFSARAARNRREETG